MHRVTLGVDEAGRAVFGFEINGRVIHDACRSECGNYGVETADAYGISP